MPSPPTFQLISMINVDSVSSVSTWQQGVSISLPATLSRPHVALENVAGKIRTTKHMSSCGWQWHRHCSATRPSSSFMRVATAGCEPTAHSFGKFSGSGSGSPLRTIGIRDSVPNSSPSEAIKLARRASGLAVYSGVVGAPLAIAIKDLALSVKGDRGDVPVLKDCSLNVPEGQFWMLLGPNGCGKSTLLKAMAGLLRPNGGQMYVIGPRSFVFQNPDHQVVMPTAEADVAFGSGRFDLPLEEVRKRVYESLDAVGMAEYAQRSVQTLSGGQKQRIAIAGALAESSRLLLLDELTTYLDSGDQIGVLEAVLKVVRGPHAVTALWVTHRLEELEYADGAAYMENGRVVLSGSVADIKKHIQMRQEEYFKGH
ncbi:unnamed protein product [Calypogeia fissa]